MAEPTPRPPNIPPEDHIFVEDVKKNFGSTIVIRGITMHLRRKETAVIIGGSGAGKTTLLRMLIGLEKPTTGHIWVDGEDIGTCDEYQMNRVRQKFGMVYQYAALLDSLNVLDNVAFPLREGGPAVFVGLGARRLEHCVEHLVRHGTSIGARCPLASRGASRGGPPRPPA